MLSDPGQDLWSFLHLICNFPRVIITWLRALYTVYTSIWELIGMLWSYDKLPLSPAPSSPAVFIIRQNKPWSSEVILPGVRRCRSYRAGNKQNSSYNDVILSPSSHKQPSVRWAQKHDNLFPAFNCTLSRVIQHSESQHNKQQYSDFLTEVWRHSSVWPLPDQTGCSQYSRNNSNYTPAAAATLCGLESLNKWLPSCGHHHGLPSCGHKPRVQARTRLTCLCYVLWATAKVKIM